MAKLNIILPAMGEGVIEAILNKWLVKEGDRVKEDDPVAEIATDKVDSEIQSPAGGIIISLIAREGSAVKVGDIIAIIEYDSVPDPEKAMKVSREVERIRETIKEVKSEISESEISTESLKSRTPSGKFLSPLVRSIASGNGLSLSELDNIKGTGMDGRITRDDVLNFIKNSDKSISGKSTDLEQSEPGGTIKENNDNIEQVKGSFRPDGDEIIEMDRVRKLIADHMVLSKKTSPHVTSFIDADVTKLVRWRNSVKDTFLADEGQKLTLTPIFLEAAARALQEFPMINISVDGTRIIKKKNINIGMAAALPDGNLIVPVIKNADNKSLRGIAREVNDLASRARNNQLKPDEIAGGTFTITNFGTYNNLAGTPIINQPQAAILGTGAVRKRPAVIETPDGDMIAIRHIMILSLSYDHRVIDGALAGRFLNKIKDLLENYPPAEV